LGTLIDSAKLYSYFKLLSYFPKTTADNLDFLINEVAFQVSAQKELLDSFKEKLIDSCASMLTFLNGPQGSYSTFMTLTCGSPDNEVAMRIINSSNNTALLEQICASNFIDDYNSSCDLNNFEMYYSLGMLALVLTILGAGWCLQKTCRNTNTTPVPRNEEPANEEPAAAPSAAPAAAPISSEPITTEEVEGAEELQPGAPMPTSAASYRRF
jgi:hypothetical protein